MSALYERCVVLKNLPPEYEESSVREELDLAHGDFCFENKFEKLHKHIEFDNDVRWIVLFKTKTDAVDCIRRGSWESSVVKGGCHVTPDYCSGCIIPDEWEEETPEDEAAGWDFGDNTVPDCALGTSEDTLYSFVKIDSIRHQEDEYKAKNDEEEPECIHDQKPAVPTFGSNHNKQTEISLPNLELNEDFMETVNIKYENDFESCCSDSEHSDILFSSGKQTNDPPRSFTGKDDAKPSRDGIHLSDERLSSSELFGSGSRKEITKTSHGSNNGSLKVDRRNEELKKSSSEVRDTEDGKSQVNSVSSNELFGSGSRKFKTSVTSSRKSFDEKEVEPNTPNEELSCGDTSDNVKNILCSEVHVPHNEDSRLENTKAIDTNKNGTEEKRSWNASVRSVDMFGSGDDNFQSLEFLYNKDKDQPVEERTETSFNSKIDELDVVKGQSQASAPDKHLSHTGSEPAVSVPQNEASLNSAVPDQSQLWASNNYYHQLLPNYTACIPAAGQHCPAPMQGALNPNFMGFHTNPMYQMQYSSIIQPTFPEGMGQPVRQHAPSGMAMPPVVYQYVPVYMHGMPPVSSTAQTVHKSEDRGERPQKDADTKNHHISSQDLVKKLDNTETAQDAFIYDTPYETIAIEPTVSKNAYSKDVAERDNDASRSNDKDLTQSNMPACQVTYMDDENIYDEVDESKLKSLRSPPKTEPRKGYMTGSPTSEQGNLRSARSFENPAYAATKRPPLPRPRIPLDKQICRDKVATEPNPSHLNVYEGSESEETSKTVEKKMILVKGISEKTSNEALELYFENKRKTGGGEIENVEINVKKGQAIIEFKRSEDALNVIQKATSGQKFTLSKQELTVSEYHPPPSDPLKLFIGNIAETTTSECITNFIGTQGRSEPTAVIFGETPGTAMVLFETTQDVSTLRTLCAKRKCEGKYWTISAVEMTRSVKVTGVNQKTTSDTLCLYFENKKRSQGGDVDNVNCRQEDFIVTFFDAKDAERVCQACHSLSGQELTVALYYPCLELDEDFIFRLPPPLLIEDMDEYILKYILGSKQYKADLESRLQSHYGSVVWPSTDVGKNKNVIQIVCSVNPKDKKGYAKVKDWTEKCMSDVREITEQLSVERSKNVAVEVWPELKARLREVEVSHPDAIAVFLESSDCVIVMAGELLHVRNMSTQITDILKDIEKKLESSRQIITKKKRLRTYEMVLVRASRLESTLKKTLVEFEIDNEQKEVICKGKQKDVDDALSKLDDKLKSFVKKQVPGMTKQAIDLLFKKETRDYVKKKMITKKVIGVWDVQRGTVLVMYSKNEKELNVAIEIVQTSIVMDSLELDSEKKKILNSNEGKSKMAEYEENHKGSLHFEIQPTELSFVSVDVIHQEIKDEFTKLFDLHSVISKSLPTDPGVFSYITTYKRKEIEAIEDQYKRLSVLIEVKESLPEQGFVVKGKKDGCKLAVNKLQSLIDSVVHKDHTLQWPGFDKFVQSTEGRDCVKNIEFTERCVIKVSLEGLRSGFENTTRKKTVSPERKETGTRITKEVKIGSLASENVDVIVNSTNKDLDMNVGAISRTLLKAGGDKLEQECKTKYPDGIKPGTVAVTSGGAMTCKALFHGLLVKWDGGSGHAERVMGDFVKTCLSLASKGQVSSIAFPALGTGAMGFPADVVAKLMFEMVDAFGADNPETCIRTVRFIVWSEDKITARAFQDAESRTVRRRTLPASPGSRHSYRHSAAAENFIVKNDGFSSMIGQVSISIVQDDLTAMTSGAIVNSTMDDLNLNSGAISKAILATAGYSIQNEATTQKSKFITEGLVVTSPGQLMCQKIIHARARNSTKGWAETIKKCLNKTEQLGLISIALPALGTGGKGVPADHMARTMIEAFQDYIQSSDFQKCLKTIRIVIFDRKMLEVFITEAKSTINPDTTVKRKSRLPDLRFWENKRSAEANSGVTMHIYARSPYAVENVVSEIDKIRRENKLFVPKYVCEHLEETHKTDLKRIGYTHGVKVVVERSFVKVMGYGTAADTATKKTETYIETIEKDIKKGNVASSLKLPSSWSKMKLSDPTKIVMLFAGDQAYVQIARRFQQETGYSSTSIVKIERIQNPTLFTQYVGKKTQMELANKGGRKVEQTLWHGTKSTAVDNINTKGFDRNYNSGSSHGVGVYFAVKASTSASGYCRADANGHKHIYLAHVLTGDYCVGLGAIRVPPTKTSSPLTTFDSTTDNVQNPNFFVIFHDAQAYPSFLITFR